MTYTFKIKTIEKQGIKLEESRMQKRSAKWAKTKTLEAKDAPIDALPAQLLFIELKVDEREAFLCSLCYGLLNCLVSVQRQWKDPSISLSISTALTCTFHLVHRPHESDLALYCPPRKLHCDWAISSIWPSYSVWKDSWLTLRLSLLTWIGILGSIPPYPLEAPCFLYVQLRF